MQLVATGSREAFEVIYKMHFIVVYHFAKRLVAAGVDKDVRGWEKTSDHAPVWIEIKQEKFALKCSDWVDKIHSYSELQGAVISLIGNNDQGVTLPG